VGFVALLPTAENCKTTATVRSFGCWLSGWGWGCFAQVNRLRGIENTEADFLNMHIYLCYDNLIGKYYSSKKYNVLHLIHLAKYLIQRNL
jgi:hypothetical protein